MPVFSLFTPFGMLDFSSLSTQAEAIYRSMVASLEQGIDMSPGSPDEAETYADAMALARASYTLQRAANSLDPRRATELIPNLERDYDVRPAPSDDLYARRMRLAALQHLPRGGSYLNIRAALNDLLAEDFVAYVVNSGGQTIPDAASVGSVANFQPEGVPPKFLRLLEPITDLNVPLRVAYEPMDAFAGDAVLTTGDAVVVSAEGTSQAERVVVSDPQVIDGERTFVGTFRTAHDVGSIVTTMDFPSWSGVQRTATIVLRAAAAIDSEKRRRVHELLRRMARAVSTWAIVAPSATAPTNVTIGPFRLPALLGTTPLAQATVSRLP
ncbi:hypothetical protein LZC95_08085 [Pendulispora brunnea]|uniref:Uncharacterized protein n=1 Tax=Pendulispora brunnea TaxID=2905690 RepID=A0ABZ2KDX5_9BACT